MIPRIAGALVALVLATAATSALAGGPVNKTLFGNAIDGYDAVAYFTDSQPVEGSSDFTYDWMGATWRFANAEHRDMFAADPEKYAPAYGGYCAYGVAKGKKPSIDPEAWAIVDGRLYLNLSKKVQALWQKDIPGYIAKADQVWPTIKDE
jgi:YHS domain-containing protein